MCHVFVTVSYLYFTQKLHYVPFQYTKLLSLTVLAVIIIIISLVFHSHDFLFEQVSFKLLSVLAFCVASYLIIPKENLRNLLKVSVDS